MEQARQKALEMKDKLVQDFQEIRNMFYNDTGGEKPKPRHVKQPNGTYKIIRKASSYPSWTSEPEGIEWLDKTDTFFDYLINELEDTNKLFGEICDEVYIITRTVNRNGDSTTLDLATCSKEAFGIAMTRICLKENNLPMQYAPNWKQFAKYYTKYVMDAT